MALWDLNLLLLRNLEVLSDKHACQWVAICAGVILCIGPEATVLEVEEKYCSNRALRAMTLRSKLDGMSLQDIQDPIDETEIRDVCSTIEFAVSAPTHLYVNPFTFRLMDQYTSDAILVETPSERVGLDELMVRFEKLDERANADTNQRTIDSLRRFVPPRAQLSIAVCAGVVLGLGYHDDVIESARQTKLGDAVFVTPFNQEITHKEESSTIQKVQAATETKTNDNSFEGASSLFEQFEFLQEGPGLLSLYYDDLTGTIQTTTNATTTNALRPSRWVTASELKLRCDSLGQDQEAGVTNDDIAKQFDPYLAELRLGLCAGVVIAIATEDQVMKAIDDFCSNDSMYYVTFISRRKVSNNLRNQGAKDLLLLNPSEPTTYESLQVLPHEGETKCRYNAARRNPIPYPDVPFTLCSKQPNSFVEPDGRLWASFDFSIFPWCKPSENSVENKDQEIRRWIWALVDTGSPKTHLSANCMLHIFPNFQPVFDRIAEGTLQIYPRFSFCGDQRRSRMSNNSIEHCRISWARIADRPDLEIINIVGFTTLRRCGFILTCDFESKTLTLQRENDQFWDCESPDELEIKEQTNEYLKLRAPTHLPECPKVCLDTNPVKIPAKLPLTLMHDTAPDPPYFITPDEGRLWIALEVELSSEVALDHEFFVAARTSRWLWHVVDTGTAATLVSATCLFHIVSHHRKLAFNG